MSRETFNCLSCEMAGIQGGEGGDGRQCARSSQVGRASICLRATSLLDALGGTRHAINCTASPAACSCGGGVNDPTLRTAAAPIAQALPRRVADPDAASAGTGGASASARRKSKEGR